MSKVRQDYWPRVTLRMFGLWMFGLGIAIVAKSAVPNPAPTDILRVLFFTIGCLFFSAIWEFLNEKGEK